MACKTYYNNINPYSKVCYTHNNNQVTVKTPATSYIILNNTSKPHKWIGRGRYHMDAAIVMDVSTKHKTI